MTDAWVVYLSARDLFDCALVDPGAVRNLLVGEATGCNCGNYKIMNPCFHADEH